MADYGVWGVTNTELEQAVAAVDPSALLVPARIVRRVLRLDRGLADSGMRLPHRKTYFISREALLGFAEPEELGQSDGTTLPETVILLARPEPEQLASVTRERALVKYWRLLFHARVHVELDKLVTDDRLNASVVDNRIEQIGKIEFEEIRTVLKQENMLLPPVDDVSTYVEFVATYTELKFFAPRLLSDYFPSIRDWRAIDGVIGQDFDAPRWFGATRLPGSPEPHEQTVEDEEALIERRSDPTATNPRKQSDRLYCRMMNMADGARVKGNDVRSAIMRWWAALRIGPKLARTARDQGRDDVRHLADRFTHAVDVPEEERGAWGDLLVELLPVATRGIVSPEARFLYDLQRACVDHEQGIFQLDLRRWIFSRGRTPLKRSVPNQREVMIAKHLKTAQGRLPTLRLPAMSRDRLAALLRSAVERAAHQLRETFRPRFEAALDEVGLTPLNRAEAVARRKLIEELLDRVVERGFVNMGDLRDAISKNNLKLRDITSLRELWTGDEALRADKSLARNLDGVYRPGEVYRRIPQWISSAAFGTKYGRLLTRYALIPFGGAYVTLEFIQHLAHKPYEWAHAGEPHFLTTQAVLLVGCFIIMLYSPAFRSGLREVFRSVVRAFHDAFVTWPKRFAALKLIRELTQTTAYRVVQQYVFKPLVTMFVLGVLASLIQFRIIGWWQWLAVFMAANLLVNSRPGRMFDEWLSDVASRSWHQLRLRVFKTMFQAVMDFSHEMLDGLEGILYSVDEWLRFRTGESRVATAFKAVLGFFWYFVNYVVRFAVTLLIEPQINPIKHFPVVTVGHKIILPLAFTTDIKNNASWLAQQILWMFDSMSIETANWIAGSVVWVIPGIFGYVAWELRSNWYLYDANRAPNLKPVSVGHHGESIMRLLRPGFHSGTIPKTFGKLRRADRKAQALGAWEGPRKYHDRLHEVREDVERFIDRELVELLAASPHCGPLGLKRTEVGMGTNHLRIGLAGTGEFTVPLVMSLEEKAGWLAARTDWPEWFERLGPEAARALQMAIFGFYKQCGVELVHEQIEECFAPDVPRYELCDKGLMAWSAVPADGPVLYDLRTDADTSQLVSPTTPCSMPTLDRQRLVFAGAPIRWAQWVDFWERDGRRTHESHLPEAFRTRNGTSSRAG
jgi:hypothetical protein